MYQKTSQIILPGMKISEMIAVNHYLILMLEHFGIDLAVHERTVEQVCREKNISLDLFLAFAALFNGQKPAVTSFSFNDIKTIISYLISSHQYYLEEKYPGLKDHIHQMFEANDLPEVHMAEQFFNEYFNEVKEHLDFENSVIFPYALDLLGKLNDSANMKNKGEHSAAEYKSHHNDIEDKLADLKNLLIKYLPLRNDQSIRRRLLFSLFELEYDLSVHTLIEETILIPLLGELEAHLKKAL